MIDEKTAHDHLTDLQISNLISKMKRRIKKFERHIDDIKNAIDVDGDNIVFFQNVLKERTC